MLTTPAPIPAQRSERTGRPSVAPAPQPQRRRWGLSATLTLGLAGSLLLWAAFPPLNLAWLAWLAPLPWLWLARLPQLAGRRPYVALWLAGFVHWLIMLQGIRLAHGALYAGWIALAAYLGVYLPVFVGLTRVAVHRLQMSVVVAAPIVWVGLELLRGHLITGFSMGLLAHTQAEFPLLIQIADLGGGYTLSLVLMLVAACLARMIPLPHEGTLTRAAVAWWSLIPVAAALAATLAYGWFRLAQTPPGATGPTAHVALIQGSLDTVFETSPELMQQRVQQTFDHYRQLTARATAEHPNLDLVIWPESMFAYPEPLAEEPLAPLPHNKLSADELRDALGDAQRAFRALLASEAELANAHTDLTRPGTLLLVGTTTSVYGPFLPRTYNSALLANRSGTIVGRYYKMHPVMFGEYIPLGDAIPLLYELTPMTGGLSAGDGPQVFEVAGLKFSPSICFESTVPHLIRRHVAELARRGTPTDVLVNVTNDGWFWGTAILDLHFRCSVFRAVENRKPLLIAANTGISAWVDGNGIVRQRGPRRQPEVLLAEVRTNGRASPYYAIGDLPAWLCAAACVCFGVVGVWKRRQAAK